jgi:hypothetical protein
MKMEHHFANDGDLSRRPRVDPVKDMEARRKNFGDRNENAGAVAQRLQKASVKIPETRTNQPPPFAKSEQENRRNLPETPRERQKQRQEERRQEANTGRGPRAARPTAGEGQQQQKATGRGSPQGPAAAPGQNQPGTQQRWAGAKSNKANRKWDCTRNKPGRANGPASAESGAAPATGHQLERQKQQRKGATKQAQQRNKDSKAAKRLAGAIMRGEDRFAQSCISIVEVLASTNFQWLF